MTPMLAFNLALARQAHTGYRRCIDWAFNLPTVVVQPAPVRHPLHGRSAEVRARRMQVHRSNRVSNLSPEKLAYKRAYNRRYAERLKQQALALETES